ncbi:hypothetical protein [Aidingimonas halophila]|uniref:Phage transcriptional regulator, ArpU family n=1 Tax=Aidingimonas halophila TaxID=574349 RepID=A0A1H2REY2_9GAMM|nr:hypothetical protein [Aidingimonas halophila]GHC19348.1 hypothetical protein GCM10008094_06670 [Aidingimonas halophila]SDW18002.1 hypothetical protein SAMN05443545_101306 [Aidingimonas halophila]
MIKQMDDLLIHWADQLRGKGMRQCSPIGKLVEFGGIPPRSTGAKGSRDPLNLGEMDEMSWAVDCALRSLNYRDQTMAHEHYRGHGYSDEKCRRLGMARQTYYDALQRLHENLLIALRKQASPKSLMDFGA